MNTGGMGKRDFILQGLHWNRMQRFFLYRMTRWKSLLIVLLPVMWSFRSMHNKCNKTWKINLQPQLSTPMIDMSATATSFPRQSRLILTKSQTLSAWALVVMQQASSHPKAVSTWWAFVSDFSTWLSDGFLLVNSLASMTKMLNEIC